MSKSHDLLIEAAKEAIDAVYSDRSVAPRDTIDSLRDLEEHIQISISCLRSDLKRDGEE